MLLQSHPDLPLSSNWPPGPCHQQGGCRGGRRWNPCGSLSRSAGWVPCNTCEMQWLDTMTGRQGALPSVPRTSASTAHTESAGQAVCRRPLGASRWTDQPCRTELSYLGKGRGSGTHQESHISAVCKITTLHFKQFIAKKYVSEYISCYSEKKNLNYWRNYTAGGQGQHCMILDT